MAWAHRASARSGRLSRQLRWPMGLGAPYRQPRLHVVRPRALGDVLMCTPALRLLKQLNPGAHVTFYTELPALVEGLPFLDAVRPTAEVADRYAEDPTRVVWMEYERSLPPRRHLARVLGDNLGLAVLGGS